MFPAISRRREERAGAAGIGQQRWQGPDSDLFVDRAPIAIDSRRGVTAVDPIG